MPAPSLTDMLRKQWQSDKDSEVARLDEVRKHVAARKSSKLLLEHYRPFSNPTEVEQEDWFESANANQDHVLRVELAKLKDERKTYMLEFKTLRLIEQRRQSVRSARLATGTDDSPVARARGIALRDPKLRSLLEQSKSAASLEITREERRAVGEGMRQRQMNRALEGAERRGENALLIEFAEDVAERAEGFGLKGSDAITAIAGGKLADLQRDLSLSASAGDPMASPVLLATSKLARARQKDPNAIIGQDAALELLRASGDEVPRSRVDERMRRFITGAIGEQAGRTHGIERDLSVSFLNLIGGRSNPLSRLGLNVAASEGKSAATRIMQDVLHELRRQNDLIESGNQSQRQTARNTSRRGASVAMGSMPPP